MKNIIDNILFLAILFLILLILVNLFKSCNTSKEGLTDSPYDNTKEPTSFTTESWSDWNWKKLPTGKQCDFTKVIHKSSIVDSLDECKKQFRQNYSISNEKNQGYISHFQPLATDKDIPNCYISDVSSCNIIDAKFTTPRGEKYINQGYVLPNTTINHQIEISGTSPYDSDYLSITNKKSDSSRPLNCPSCPTCLPGTGKLQSPPPPPPPPKPSKNN